MPRENGEAIYAVAEYAVLSNEMRTHFTDGFFHCFLMLGVFIYVFS